MPLSEEEYGKRVDVCAAKKRTEFIPNGKPTHARQMLRAIFTYAHKEVRIYSGSLRLRRKPDDGEAVDIFAYPDLIAAASVFLQRPGTRLAIVTDEEIEEGADNTFLKELVRVASGTSHPQTKLTVGLLPRAGCGLDFSSHFCTIDDTGYRYETDHRKPEAFGNFGDSVITGRLLEVFDFLQECAEPYPLNFQGQ